MQLDEFLAKVHGDTPKFMTFVVCDAGHGCGLRTIDLSPRPVMRWTMGDNFPKGNYEIRFEEGEMGGCFLVVANVWLSSKEASYI